MPGMRPNASRHAEPCVTHTADDNPVVTAEQVKQALLVRLCENILGSFFLVSCARAGWGGFVPRNLPVEATL